LVVFGGISGHFWAFLDIFESFLAVGRYWSLLAKDSSFPEVKTMDLKYGTTDFSEKIRIFHKSSQRVPMHVLVNYGHV
jgi:hypothetical protein